MLEFFLEWMEHRPVFVGALLVLLPLMIPKARQLPGWIWRWLNRKRIAEEKEEKKALESYRTDLSDSIKGIATKVGTLEEMAQRTHRALFNGGHDGLVHQVGRLTAVAATQFEMAKHPAFECDSNGNNRAVNHAYRTLVGVNRDGDLRGSGWRNALHGGSAREYLRRFEQCAASRQDFVADVDFRNPFDGEHRGRWRVYAPAAMVGEECIYSGRFIAALDPTAAAIARENGWDVEIEEVPGEK